MNPIETAYDQKVAECEALRQQLAEAQAQIESLKTIPPYKREDLCCVISDLCEQVRERDKQLAAAQAHIDELMLEYCPEEMTPEQLDEWARNQKGVEE